MPSQNLQLFLHHIHRFICPTVKIISFNISKCTQAKIDHILAMDADLFILPECANSEYVKLSKGYNMLWTGDDDTPMKGWQEQKTYPQLLLEVLQKYSNYLEHFPALVIGDFNCYIGQRGVRKNSGTFEDCIKVLESHGMKSLYHEMTGEEFGMESQATFFWRFKEESPFFLDYAFSNLKPMSFEIGQWEKTISDHRPLIVNLKTENYTKP